METLPYRNKKEKEILDRKMASCRNCSFDDNGFYCIKDICRCKGEIKIVIIEEINDK